VRDLLHDGGLLFADHVQQPLGSRDGTHAFVVARVELGDALAVTARRCVERLLGSGLW